MLKARKYLLTAAAIATALTLSACTGTMTGTDEDPNGGTTSSPTSVRHNAADVTFAQMMLPHHEQAVEMSDDILAKDGVDQRVIDLATQIKAAQKPEIKQLKQWLTTWGADKGNMSGMSGMDSGVGTMSVDDMMALKNSSGAAANKLFVEQMTAHHEGAIAMAQTELEAGRNNDSLSLAKAIVTSQTAEVGQMKLLLTKL